MSSQVISRTEQTLTVQITFSLEGTMLMVEEGIQDAIKEAGQIATEEKLRSLDTDGTPIIIGNVKFTSKGQFPENYETPYGSISIVRHVYQNNDGGKTWCPMEERARMILNATPKYAKTVSYKYAHLGAEKVVDDLLENERRNISSRYVKSLGDAIGAIAQAKEETWEYALPKLDGEVACVGVGVDGAYIPMKDGKWREAMAGSISLYDSEGERLHTICIGATPEYGKEKFHERFLRELNRVKETLKGITDEPSGRVIYIGLGDGAKDNWTFMTPHTDEQILDFFHASEYVSDVASVLFKGKKKDNERKTWLQARLHILKHDEDGAKTLRKEMEEILNDATRKPRLTKDDKETISASVTYFTNQGPRMEYWLYREQGWPIGSGVTEATCKTLIKARFCGSGARWKDEGASFVMSIRSLILTTQRWHQFWSKIDAQGCPSIPKSSVV